MVGGVAGAEAFFHFVTTLTLLSMAYHALGLWLGALFPTASSALFWGLFAQAVLFLFGSMLVPGPSIPSGWRWLWHANPLHYAAEAVWITQFYCSPADVDAGRCPMFSIGPDVPLSPLVKWVSAAGSI